MGTVLDLVEEEDLVAGLAVSEWDRRVGCFGWVLVAVVIEKKHRKESFRYWYFLGDW